MLFILYFSIESNVYIYIYRRCYYILLNICHSFRSLTFPFVLIIYFFSWLIPRILVFFIFPYSVRNYWCVDILEIMSLPRNVVVHFSFCTRPRWNGIIFMRPTLHRRKETAKNDPESIVFLKKKKHIKNASVHPFVESQTE